MSDAVPPAEREESVVPTGGEDSGAEPSKSNTAEQAATGLGASESSSSETNAFGTTSSGTNVSGAHVSETTGAMFRPAPVDEPVERAMPTSQPVFMKALRIGAVSTLVLLVLCGGIGWLIAGSPGLIGGALGAAFAGIFLGLTIASIAFANRLINSDFYVVAFFSIVVGGWVLKFVAFIVAAVLLRDEPWLDPHILFFSLIAGVLVSLAIDVFIVTKSRLPYISDPKRG